MRMVARSAVRPTSVIVYADRYVSGLPALRVFTSAAMVAVDPTLNLAHVG